MRWNFKKPRYMYNLKQMNLKNTELDIIVNSENTCTKYKPIRVQAEDREVWVNHRPERNGWKHFA
jgi:hypothetical protein